MRKIQISQENIKSMRCCGNCSHYYEYHCFCYHEWKPYMPPCGNPLSQWALNPHLKKL
jgi:hypothetical protein